MRSNFFEYFAGMINIRLWTACPSLSNIIFLVLGLGAGLYLFLVILYNLNLNTKI